MTATDDERPEMFLDTLEGEIAFFRSLMRARPVGLHRHFHAMALRAAIQRETGRWVPIEELWIKLRACYDMDLLESIEIDGFDVPGSHHHPNGVPFRSPSPSENLAAHPYFRAEFSLPDDPFVDEMVSRRRLRATASLPSTSPAPPSPREKPSTIRASKRGKNKAKLNQTAGLVGGDSDSSALTQESGDESIAATPATGTDAATEYGEEASVDTAPSSAKTRKTTKGTRRNSNAQSSKTKPVAASTRGVKKRKR